MSDRASWRDTFNSVCRFSAEGFRLFIQWGFVPFVVYLGSRKPAILPTGEQVPITVGSLFYG